MSEPPPVILNVDDSEDRLRYRSAVLLGAGFDPVAARTGAEAIERAGRIHPSLVLLDVHLPDIDGFEVCRRLKSTPRFTRLPVLHISAACRTDRDVIAGLRAGSAGYLREPVSDEVLIESIHAALRRAAEAAALDRARHAAEAALQASETRCRELVAHAPYGICSADASGVITSANPAFWRMIGCTLETANRPVDVSALFMRREQGVEALRAIEAGELGTNGIAATWRRHDGQQIRVLVSGRCVPTGFELFVDDVTERLAIEAQLRQANKLEALGLLTAGVAHDFNNTLTVILGFTEMSATHVGRDSQLGRDLAEIQAAAKHAAELSRRMLAFAKDQPLEMNLVDMNALARDAVAMLGPLLGEAIQLEVTTDNRACVIAGDRAQLQQILMNLAANARDAMPEGGPVSIEVARAQIDARFAAQHPPLHVGLFVRLRVRDQGHGMSEDVKSRIFDPFFTTKELGRGTGLGLSTVYGVTKQLGGFLFVESAAGQGTQFELYFPAASGTPAAKAADRDRAQTRVRRARVLVVEDDAPVRALTVGTLRRHGYDVIEASQPSEVMRLEPAVTADLDLLLTDIVMPGLSGRTVARQLTARHPRMRVLYMSGYAAPDGSNDGARVLWKPFGSAELIEAVRKALDEVTPEARRVEC